MNVVTDSLPSGQKFFLDLNLNHPTLLPGVQVLTESTLYRGGKLFRPRLCFMMAEAIGLPLERVAPFARIAEMVHGATLAHDDVIDEATERRKKTTLNAKITQARAVLAGDLMLSRAMVELCDLGYPSILKRMSEVLEDLVTGEWLQLENRGELQLSPQTLEAVAVYKTAAMFEWCAEMPFHINGATPDLIASARKFGRSLGLAFQSIDDCLDFSDRSGKGYSQDLSEGLLNQVTSVLISNHPGLDSYFKSILSGDLKPELKSFLREVGEKNLIIALEEVRGRAAFQLRIAKDTLINLERSLDGEGNFLFLHELLEQLLTREN